MAEVGRPSDLTQELTLKIRALVLDGQSYENIKQILDIPDGTWDSWIYKNYMDLRTSLINWKHERMTKKAEVKVETLIESEDEKVALNASTFVLERLNKKEYSSKTETDITSGGQSLQPVLVKFIDGKPESQDNRDTPGV